MVVYYNRFVKKKMPTLTEKLIKLRAQASLSREKFAKSLGYSKSYLTDIETGRTKPSRRFLEAVGRVCGVSIDWLISDSKILDLIEANKKTSDPRIIFVYSFTQRGLDDAEKTLRELLADRIYILADVSGAKTVPQFIKKILNEEGKTGDLWRKLENILLNEEIVLIIKNISLSKIPSSGYHIRSIFKIMDDAWDVEGIRKKIEKGNHSTMVHKMPPSSLIVLDFPSYLEKNMKSFGYYACPIRL